ncbi:hypothetical protein N4T77_06675 [Clostridium sp. CX1]|uniref:hypothetical protein n=1 Tax=Clostridium sp. CX1 TaxID=2978346 RepID=UPI0021BEAE63|nr:hypothetical protein [Clostridium sp. CX1]MCT8976277.1 hypothetical protein [Clostridium sp. CX1]
MVQILYMFQEATCLGKIFIIDELMYLDKLVASKAMSLCTPYNLFIGGTAAYLFVHCYIAMKNNKKGAK